MGEHEERIGDEVAVGHLDKEMRETFCAALASARAKAKVSLGVYNAGKLRLNATRLGTDRGTL